MKNPGDDYIGDQKCPHCGHHLNHAMDTEGDDVDHNAGPPNTVRLGVCWFCTEVIGSIGGKIIELPEGLLEELEKQYPESYTKLMEAVNTIREVKNEDS